MRLTELEHDRRTDILLGLSPDALASRQDCVGASDMNIIMGGDEAAILRLWQTKVGLAAPEDLSDVLAVQMGIWTEDFNLRWFERQTGKKVSERRRRVSHPDYPFLVATLDGTTEHPETGQPAVIDAKHVGPFYYDADKTLHKYTPQLTVQMAVRDVPYGLLSIFSGSNKWEWRGIERDELREAQVIAAARKFWACVESKTPPVDSPSLPEPLPKALLRKVDMKTSNAWCDAEARYLQYEQQADAFDEAKKDLKALVGEDVGEAAGQKIRIKRDANGALRISRMKK